MWIDDQVLSRYKEAMAIEAFVPSSTMVVLGSGNDTKSEVLEAACISEGIPIIRRYGGGGTVVLYPGCVVLTVGAWVKEQFQNNFYFRCLNGAVIETLSSAWPIFENLRQAGISDIVFENKKIAGTSLFRSRNYLLYQASIIVELDRALINRVLCHPSKEPDYRAGRDHGSFLSSLREVNPLIPSPQEVCQKLAAGIGAALATCLDDHLIAPLATQTSALEARLARSLGQ